MYMHVLYIICIYVSSERRRSRGTETAATVAARIYYDSLMHSIFLFSLYIYRLLSPRDNERKGIYVCIDPQLSLASSGDLVVVLSRCTGIAVFFPFLPPLQKNHIHRRSHSHGRPSRNTFSFFS